MLLEQAADKVLRTSMELGGNAPFLVFADADLDAAVEGAMTAKMRNMGEACTAANRFLVHRSVADAFADQLAERMAALRVGRGTDDGVQVGPLIDAKGREKVVGARRRRRRPGRDRPGRRRGPSTGPAGSTGPPCSPTCRWRRG